MKVDLHIERLVLEGVEPGRRHEVAGALERELGRLIAGGGLPAALREGRDLGRIDGGRLERDRRRTAVTTGRGIARGVYRALGGAAPTSRPTEGAR